MEAGGGASPLAPEDCGGSTEGGGSGGRCGSAERCGAGKRCGSGETPALRARSNSNGVGRGALAVGGTTGAAIGREGGGRAAGRAGASPKPASACSMGNSL